jgi:putative chitinase
MPDINWTQTQKNLKAAGFDPNGVDGKPGPGTYRALFAYAAGRQPDLAIVKLAQGAAAHFPFYGMTTRNRVGEALANFANETGGFSTFVEDTTYSATRLAEVWPGRYAVNPHADVLVPNAKALALHRNSIAIANDVYANRMGNGDVASGDGNRFRGRDPIQTTGRSNYAQAAADLGLDVLTHPELLEDPAIGIWAALAYWRRAGVNAYADEGRWLATRGIINVGSPHPAVKPIGLDHVAALREHIFKVLV